MQQTRIPMMVTINKLFNKKKKIIVAPPEIVERPEFTSINAFIKETNQRTLCRIYLILSFLKNRTSGTTYARLASQAYISISRVGGICKILKELNLICIKQEGAGKKKYNIIYPNKITAYDEMLKRTKYVYKDFTNNN